jgi:hypothetical protein
MLFRSRPTPWRWLLGVPLLLMFSLFDLASHLLEQNHRHHVLAKGTVASATVRAPSGLQWVTVQWNDAAGRSRVGSAWTGKPFARHIRESPQSMQAVEIKHIDSSSETVILSEAAERARINNWWIRANTGSIIVMMMLVGWGALTTLWFKRAPKGS